MKRSKPSGQKGPISFGPGRINRHLIEYPATKSEIELLIARLFCSGDSGMRPQIMRYGRFSGLEQQRENALDFTVETALGRKWLELAEFAPLNQFEGRYDGVPHAWDAATMRSMVRDLIEKKASKGYGANVVLVLYATHDTLVIPPPILRAVRAELRGETMPFEAIYFVSPHDQERASAWEIYPGDPTDAGPVAEGGTMYIGFKGFEPSDGS